MLSTLSRYATPLRLPCKICKSNLQLNDKPPLSHPDSYITTTERCCTHHVPVVEDCSEFGNFVITLMQCFYADRLESGHPRGVIKIDFRLTNVLVYNYVYSNGDGHVTNFIEPTDDVMTVVVIVWVALRTCTAY